MGECRRAGPPLVWCEVIGYGADTLPFLSLSPAVARRADPRLVRASGRASPAPLLAAVLMGSALHLGNTVELALMAKAWVNQPQGYENGRAGPVPHRLQHLGEWAPNLDWQHSGAAPRACKQES